MTGQEMFSGPGGFSGRTPLPPGALVELAALRLALPGYEVIITSRNERYRFGPFAATAKRVHGA